MLVELTLTTGLRSGEVRGLTWSNVDLATGRLFVFQSAARQGNLGATKTQTSVRTIPLAVYLLPVLREWKLAFPLSEAGLVFAGDHAAPIEADVLRRQILRRALRRPGLPELRFHNLRHITASFVVEVGASVKRARELLGHASERTTLAI